MIRLGPGRTVKGRSLLPNEQWTIVFDSLELSLRQREITLCLFDDMGENAIAHTTGLRRSTVKRYVARLYRKLDVKSRAEFLIVMFSEHLAHLHAEHIEIRLCRFDRGGLLTIEERDFDQRQVSRFG
jgi:DNA-binding CsgD family transcriptional regulator